MNLLDYILKFSSYK